MLKPPNAGRKKYAGSLRKREEGDGELGKEIARFLWDTRRQTGGTGEENEKG